MAIVFGWLVGIGVAVAGGPGARVGEPLPDLALESDVSTDGRPAVYSVWASWCVPCEKKLPKLLRLAARSPGHAFVLVALDSGGPPVDRLPDNVVAVDAAADTTKQLYGVADDGQMRVMVPYTVAVDADGTVALVEAGRSLAGLRRWLRDGS